MTPLHSCTQLEGAYGMETMIMLIWKLKHTIWSCTSLIFAHCLCMQELNDWNILIYLAYFYTACLCSSSGVFDVTGYDDDFNKFAIMFRLKYLHRMLEWYKSIKSFSMESSRKKWDLTYCIFITRVPAKINDNKLIEFEWKCLSLDIITLHMLPPFTFI